MKKVLLCLMVFAMGVMAQADLRLYYDFEGEDPGSLTVTDKSGYGFDGTREYGFSGDPDWETLPQYVASHDSSTAMQFGYTDGGVAGATWNDITVGTGYNNTLARVGQGWSMAFWCRQDMNVGVWTGEYARVISCPNYEIELGSADYLDNAAWFWPYEADPAWDWETNVGSWDMYMAPTPFQDWFHMAVTYDGTTLTQYVNGVPVYTNDTMPGPFLEDTWQDVFPDSALRIGTQTGGYDKNYLVGLLDDVAIWGNGYLDADAVAGLYSGQYTPLTAPETIPEPATLALLALGGILLRKRS